MLDPECQVNLELVYPLNAQDIHTITQYQNSKRPILY